MLCYTCISDIAFKQRRIINIIKIHLQFLELLKIFLSLHFYYEMQFSELIKGSYECKCIMLG